MITYSKYYGGLLAGSYLHRGKKNKERETDGHLTTCLLQPAKRALVELLLAEQGALH